MTTVGSENRIIQLPSNISISAVLETSNGTSSYQLPITDHLDGNYTVKLKVQEKGINRLTMTVGDNQIPGSPFNIKALSIQDMVMQVRKNTKVRRGRDWKWGNQDGDPPGVGTVKRVIGGSVYVTWDHGKTDDLGLGNVQSIQIPLGCKRFDSQFCFHYRMNAHGACDLQPAQFY
ncbi:uncharacterized protein LOC102807577 [Saccoglossus kowalevskii]|uniref:Uncharacterized protein LOC102807577 n=1 Tax=Saccoglossus kowalevskii TaxID=10224 RepID=A0ABM0MKT9_SACKO|nr:PREDICTED: uncharacterized protein LOC102807577 [Saccoglossus kowalevskii]